MDFKSAVLESEIPVLVDFYAGWCMPCRMLAPVLEKLAREFEGRVKVLKVDVEAELPLAGSWGINAVPTLLLFEGGRVRDTVQGLVSPTELQARLERVAAAVVPRREAGSGSRG